MKNNILLVDYGNSYIKAGIYDAYQEKIVETVSCPKTTNPRELLTKFSFLGDKRPTKIVECCTAESKYAEPFNEKLSELLKAPISLLSFADFSKDINVDKSKTAKEIGADILCVAYYQKHLNAKSAVFCLGTVYFVFVYDVNQPVDCQFVPSIVKGLKRISEQTAIAQDYIPVSDFKQQVGEDTHSCFSAGADTIMTAWVEHIMKRENIKPENIIISGGDAHNFTTVCKKYKVVDNIVLKAMEMLAKEKNW